MPRLERGGSIEGSEHHWFGGGVALSEDGVELAVLERGARSPASCSSGIPTHSVTIEERVVAVALTDQLGVAPRARRDPRNEQARLADRDSAGVGGPCSTS